MILFPKPFTSKLKVIFGKLGALFSFENNFGILACKDWKVGGCIINKPQMVICHECCNHFYKKYN